MHRTLALTIGILFTTNAIAQAPDGWLQKSPRDEIKPHFFYDGSGGPKQAGAFVITADKIEGQHGWWQKTYSIIGGKHYQFQAVRKTDNVDVPRRSAIARVLWQDDKGQAVYVDPPPDSPSTKGLPRAEPEYPRDFETTAVRWTFVAGLYLAPSKATKAIVELHLRWAPGGRVEWSQVSLNESAPPKSRPVRLAAVHLQPRGDKAPMDNCRMFEPHIADAARQKADLVVLGETITYVGLGKSVADVAERSRPINGILCAGKKHNIYIVVGLVGGGASHLQRRVLIGPDGIIGVSQSLPTRGEVDGVCARQGYPVFETKSAKSA